MNTAALELVLKAADCHIASERVRLGIGQDRDGIYTDNDDDLTDTQKDNIVEFSTLDTAMWMMRNTLATELRTAK